MSAPLLEVENLRLHYRTQGGVMQALDGVSFSLARGEAMVVLGESGCGKTSLSRALLRLLPRNVAEYSGVVRIDGRDVMPLSDEVFRREIRWSRVAIVMQAAMNALNPVVRVGEQVAEPLMAHQGLARAPALEAAAKALVQVGVSADFMQRYPFELSGGMRQRVVLAMALITKPDLIILDEPTSALDLLTQASIMNTLKRIKRETGTSFVLITHDVGTSSELADHVAVMYAGQIVEFSPARDFFRAPVHPYGQALMASVPRLHDLAEPQHLEGTPPPLINPPAGCRFAPRCAQRFDKCAEMPPEMQHADGRRKLCWLPEGETAGKSAAEKGAPASDLLDIRALKTHFTLRKWGFLRAGTVQALDGVSFRLARGEAVAVVGESGCGKSTLVRTLLGLDLPTEGSITIEGRALGTMDAEAQRHLRRTVGYVQQDPYGALPPFMDVATILAEPLKVHGLSNITARVLAALEEVGLTPAQEFLGKFPHMLSGGQQQRVVIARALILEPALIIADEPVSMLDASVSAGILRLLRKIQETRGLTLIFVTHNLATVRHFANRIFVMYAGRFVETGPTQALLDAPQHPYTQALLAAVSDPDPENAARERPVPDSEPPSLINPPAGCRFHPRCPQAMAGICDKDTPPAFTPRPGQTSWCWLHR
ncbi:MAG: ABC transporter ATP-binding protein [Rhodobacteraceae bacterium]|nr:MAG: ABC transporter ATP-binding protein [Paracoccaceae bacterium]